LQRRVSVGEAFNQLRHDAATVSDAAMNAERLAAPQALVILKKYMKGILAFPWSSPHSDEEAMWRVKLYDDHQDFDKLVRKWQDPIRNLCTRMVGDSHRGEDLKQDTFLRLFEKRKNYQPKSRFSTFLWRIALNLCYDELRRQKRRREFLTEGESGDEPVYEPTSDAPGPDLRTANLEEGELVRRAVMQLPEMYRAVVVLRHYEDMKLSGIAEILEIPEGTVNSRMAEALVRLSRMLEPKLKAAPSHFASINPLNIPKESFVL
jgi:RNA polymerase sigma-70 factor (ECF subfamily)